MNPGPVLEVSSGTIAEWSYFILAILILLVGQIVIYITNRVTTKKDIESLHQDITHVKDDVKEKSKCITIKKDIESLHQNITYVIDDVKEKSKCITKLKEKQGLYIQIDRCSEHREESKSLVNTQIAGLRDDINDLKTAVESTAIRAQEIRDDEIEWKMKINETLSRLGSAIYGQENRSGNDRRDI